MTEETRAALELADHLMTAVYLLMIAGAVAFAVEACGIRRKPKTPPLKFHAGE